MEPQQQSEEFHKAYAEHLETQRKVQIARLLALDGVVRELHPAGVQYYYNNEPSTEGMQLLTPLLFCLCASTLRLKKDKKGKWHGDFYLKHVTNPYPADKPIRAEMMLDEKRMQLNVANEMILYVPIAKMPQGKKVQKAPKKAKEPTTFAQMYYARDVTKMLNLISAREAEFLALSTPEMLAAYNNVFASISLYITHFALERYAEFTPAYIEQYNRQLAATREALIKKYNEEQEAKQQAQAMAGQAGDNTPDDGSSSPNVETTSE